MGNRPNNSQDTTGTFLGGFLNGAKSSAIVMGIFYGLYFGLTFLPLGLPAVGATMAIFAGISVLTGGIFGGMRASEAQKHGGQSHGAMMQGGHVVQASQNVAPVLMPAVMAERAQAQEQSAPTRQWAQSVGTRTDRVQEILSRQMSDSDRASAILREREERAANPQAVSV